MFAFGYAVSKPREVIELFTFVHELVLSGRSVSSALKLAHKDEKTLDRFKHIYYLHIQDNDRLVVYEEHWDTVLLLLRPPSFVNGMIYVFS